MLLDFYCMVGNRNLAILVVYGITIHVHVKVASKYLWKFEFGMQTIKFLYCIVSHWVMSNMATK